MRASRAEGRFNTLRQGIGIDLVDRGHGDHVDQILHSGIGLISGQRVGVQFLGEMLRHWVHGKPDGRDVGELEKIGALKNIRLAHKRVSERKVDVECSELLPRQAGRDRDTKTSAGCALQLLDDLAELERKAILDTARCNRRPQRRQQLIQGNVVSETQIDVARRPVGPAIAQLQREPVFSTQAELSWRRARRRSNATRCWSRCGETRSSRARFLSLCRTCSLNP